MVNCSLKVFLLFTKQKIYGIVKYANQERKKKTCLQLLEGVIKNVDYWSSYVSRKTSIEKDDAYQELLLIIWKEYCKREKAGKPITRYFLQKRLMYGASRIILRFYKDIESITYTIEGKDFIDQRTNSVFRIIWLNCILDQLMDKYKNTDPRAYKILSMFREGFRNVEISEETGIPQNTLSLILTRKVKEPLKEFYA